MLQLENIKLEHINNEYKELASKIGLDAFISLVKMSGGSHVYIPSQNTIIIDYRNKSIANEFCGNNTKELARKWSISESTVRSIARQAKIKQ